VSELHRRVADLERAIAAHFGELMVPTLVEAKEVAGLRRQVGEHLVRRGMAAYREAAEVCVGELLANAVVHLGPGVPVTLRVSTPLGRPRIALTDPDPRALPVLLRATEDEETGRGLALLSAISRRWGVDQHPDGKTVWCDPMPDLSTERCAG
jgi:anti-sigma regulatory factor (Ser/Thr protein kinase)